MIGWGVAGVARCLCFLRECVRVGERRENPECVANLIFVGLLRFLGG